MPDMKMAILARFTEDVTLGGVQCAQGNLCKCVQLHGALEQWSSVACRMALYNVSASRGHKKPCVLV